MKKIVNSVLELVGDTPMVELERLGRDAGAVARVVAKVELFNPAGSVKDRVASSKIKLNSLKSPWIRPWRARSTIIFIIPSYSYSSKHRDSIAISGWSYSVS